MTTADSIVTQLSNASRFYNSPQGAAMQPELMRTSQEDTVTSIITQVRQMNEITSEEAIYINSIISQSPLSNFLKQALVQAVVDRQSNRRPSGANWIEAQQKLREQGIT